LAGELRYIFRSIDFLPKQLTIVTVEQQNDSYAAINTPEK
jgi:hypothetical protein